jgi:hypothetical protein
MMPIRYLVRRLCRPRSCLVVITALLMLSASSTTAPLLGQLLGAGPASACQETLSPSTPGTPQVCAQNQTPCAVLQTPQAASTPAPSTSSASPTPVPSGAPSALSVTVPNPGLLFPNVAAGSAASQTLWVENTTPSTLTWVGEVTTTDGAPWLLLSPETSTLAPGSAEQAVTVTAKATSLVPGLYQGDLTFLWAGGSQTVPVALLVTQASAQTPVASPTVGPQPTPSPTVSFPPCTATPCLTASPTPSVSDGIPPGTATGTPPRDSPTPTDSATPFCQGSDPGSGASACSAQSPYGFTTPHADARLVWFYDQLGVCWVRYQIHASSLVSPTGAYQWSQLDTVVATMNAAHIHLDVPLECFAPKGGGTDACFSHPYLPTPQEMATFAQALATRYDGRHGHGRIDAFEIGNEEYDFFPSTSYGPILQAGYRAIKAVDPSFLVGMYGTARPSLSHLAAVMNALRPYTQDFDYANFHYYAHGGDPTVSTADHPSFAAVWQLIARALPGKPIWCTEVGWPVAPLPGIAAVSPEIQAQYMQDVLTSASQSGVITRLFWFTLDDGTQPDDIAPGGAALAAFATYRAFVAAHPLWSQTTSLP